MTTTILDVLEKFDDVTELAIQDGEPFGYFSVIHHAATSAVFENIYRFDNPGRLTEFTVLFAEAFFEAMRGYLSGWERPGWVGVFDKDLSVMEHIELGINAHVVWDLGFTLAEIGDLPSFRHDFDVFHVVSLPVFPRAWEALDEIVPRARWLRRAATAPFWPWLFNHFRERSWTFAERLLAEPERAQQLCADQLAYTQKIDRRWRAVLPPFASGECRDVSANIVRLRKAMQ